MPPFTPLHTHTTSITLIQTNEHGPRRITVVLLSPPPILLRKYSKREKRKKENPLRKKAKKKTPSVFRIPRF